jgi:hypothetical protein
MSSNYKCCICGPVRNCGPYLDKIFENIEKIGELFEDYVILMYYDKSTDNTLEKLKEYQNKNPKLHFYVNKYQVSPYRTHRIAEARNFCLRQIWNTYEDYPFFIMMDCDDVNCKNINTNVLKKYLDRTDWDALSFQTSPCYYDIWALSIKPFTFSYNHFLNNEHYYKVIQKYVTHLLNNLKNDELLHCISAFNGFSIYRTRQFKNCWYDGNIRLDLIPKHYILKHMEITDSPIIFKEYGVVNGYYEDCEHRAFHLLAINNNNAKIRISPEIIFTPLKNSNHAADEYSSKLLVTDLDRQRQRGADSNLHQYK